MGTTDRCAHWPGHPGTEGSSGCPGSLNLWGRGPPPHDGGGAGEAGKRTCKLSAEEGDRRFSRAALDLPLEHLNPGRRRIRGPRPQEPLRGPPRTLDPRAGACDHHEPSEQAQQILSLEMRDPVTSAAGFPSKTKTKTKFISKADTSEIASFIKSIQVPGTH